jgi:hypothetical protein
MARGHLCGAVWKEIDPERPHGTLEPPDSIPFVWTDSIAVPPGERPRFSPADLRTELVPSFPIEAPDMEWQAGEIPEPVLDAEALSEIWNPVELSEALRPLASGYRAWISQQEELLAIEPPDDQRLTEPCIAECRQVLERIEEAIGLLAADDNVRLAFCFANKAIALQSTWQRKRALKWRPFQLAFMLLNIPAIADPTNAHRQTCDLLWFPTGGGKTEAYLGLVAFTLALRRRRLSNHGGGVAALSRYTLRLLTIQQFRRAVGIVTACEFLRVDGLENPGQPVGWRPREASSDENFLWGGIRFSVGLWVGAGVTPNRLLGIGPIPTPSNRYYYYAGAIDILQGASRDYRGPNSRLQRLRNYHIEAAGEPAQLLSCPACGSILSVPDRQEEGLAPGKHTLHFPFSGEIAAPPTPGLVSYDAMHLTVDDVQTTRHGSSGFGTLSVTFTVQDGFTLSGSQVDQWWYQVIAPSLAKSIQLEAARPARPGYIILTYDNVQRNERQCDFDIYCPNPDCGLNQHAWAEQVPLRRDGMEQPGTSRGLTATGQTHELPLVSGYQWQIVPGVFGCNDDVQGTRISTRIPIPAMTVDDQTYHRCPSLVVATVDKFARLAYEPKAASLFGNVTHYHARWGYYREGVPPSWGSLPTTVSPHPPGIARGNPLTTAVSPFPPPDLILQDELHLIEGPLGSMVGLYETAIDALCRSSQEGRIVQPKYIASTATVRQAEAQVASLFDRTLTRFPPWASSSADRFFAREREIHPLESTHPGRLYVGICAPGRGAQTPIIRIWASLLQVSYDLWRENPSANTDRIFTLVGFFNAIRELAGALSLYRQDIPERIRFATTAGQPRSLDDDKKLELSGRATSTELPSLLQRLESKAPDAPDAVFCTSMFGTGVDVSRLGLMVVHGQPKTTSAYIQATGRVGRESGGLVVTFLRASRPRDLDHYEFFTGYHRALHRHVEAITLAPFSPRARERGLGPLGVTILRNASVIGTHPVAREWKIEQRLGSNYYSQAHYMGSHRHDPEVEQILQLMEDRAQAQPTGRRPLAGVVAAECGSELDCWAQLAREHPDNDRFVYAEPALLRPPERHVVLGDPQHRAHQLAQAYKNAPQSLREVEETTTFRT